MLITPLVVSITSKGNAGVVPVCSGGGYHIGNFNINRGHKPQCLVVYTFCW